jgi:branched-chain amino acid aminotransferase
VTEIVNSVACVCRRVHDAPMRPLPDWDQLTFSLTEPDHMLVFRGDDTSGPSWTPAEVTPFGDVSVSPAAAFMSYGLGIFEGLKAQRCADGRVLLFRADRNAERFRKSAERMTLAPFPAQTFVEACVELVRTNLRLVPPHDKGSFYLRPLEVASGRRLGLGPVHQFLVVFYGSPVGGYFAGAKSPQPAGVRLRVLEQGRVPAGGTGAAKCMGNYAGGIRIAYEWKQKGFDDVLYLDAHETKWVSETSGSNVFVKLKDGTLVTPPLSDQILDGNTRDAAIRIARDVLRIPVEERPISIEETLADGEEVFASGTAWTLLSVRELVHRDRAHEFPTTTLREALLRQLRAIQCGTAEDRFGWTLEVPTA